jgi:hypothetical protein
MLITDVVGRRIWWVRLFLLDDVVCQPVGLAMDTPSISGQLAGFGTVLSQVFFNVRFTVIPLLSPVVYFLLLVQLVPWLSLTEIRRNAILRTVALMAQYFRVGVTCHIR